MPLDQLLRYAFEAVLAAWATVPELERIERICVEAQRRNPHNLSCDWSTLEEARSWEAVHRGSIPWPPENG